MAFNFGGAAQGGLGGAASGAALGSFAGPIGTAVGAGVGGLAGLLGGGLAKDKKPWEQSPNKYNPAQQQALDMILAQSSQGLQNPRAGFDPIANLARKQFQTQTVPGIAERFSAIGSGGAQKSSAFQSLLGSAGSDLEAQLAALGANYGLQNRAGLLGQLQLGLNPQTENIYFGQQPGFGNQLLKTGGDITGSYLQAGGNYGFGEKDQLIKSLLNYFGKKGTL